MPSILKTRDFMQRMLWRSFAILSLCSSLSAQLLMAAPAMTLSPGVESTGASRDIDLKALFQHWVHSSEEEQPGEAVQIYRPATSMHVPASRFRMAYQFAPNGVCEFYALSPDDAHRFKSCHWSMDARDKAILRISATGQSTSFRVIQLTATILRLVPLEPSPSQ